MMKKIFSFFAIILLFSLFIPAVFADGFIHIYDKDMWNLFNEKQQFCAINYKDGFQNMILTVDTGQELTGEKAVWIFPVPAKPDNTVINIVKGFPQLMGYDIQDKADESISNVFMAMRATQVYTFPVLLTMYTGRISAFNKGLDSLGGVTVHESIEKMGLTTELVSAVDGSSLTNYVTSKGLNLPESSRSILDEYTGQEYSFVISWISDIEKFKQEQREEYLEVWTGNSIGVFITFPTDKIYYPLKPTSIYGNKRVPAVIYVLDYVQPELYDGIKTDTEVNYFFENRLSAPEELRDFFAGYDLEPSTSTYYSRDGQKQGFTVEDVKYTKIKVNPPSKFLTQDLWMQVSTPLKVKAADFANRFGLLYGLIFFILCSCLASLFSGMIIFRDRPISKIKFALFGLWNFLTLIGFSIAAYISKIDLKFTQSQETQKSDVSFGKIITRALLIALAIPILFLFLFKRSFRYWDFEMLIPMFIIYAITTAFLAPFVWGYYKTRKIMKFIILFTVFFMVLTIIAQIFLSLII